MFYCWLITGNQKNHTLPNRRHHLQRPNNDDIAESDVSAEDVRMLKNMCDTIMHNTN